MKYRIYLLLGVTSLFAACSGNNKPVDLTKPTTTTARYKFGTVAEKALSTTARFPGQLIPFNEVNLFPKVNGFVKKVFADRGSMVKKGQLLVILEAPEMQSQLQSANSKYVQAQESAQASKEK